jgi:PAT family beta-lactamase induction signal transducer AmpG
VQAIAGRASIYAMLHVLVILLLDAKILGSLQGQAAGTGMTQFLLLIGSAALKLFLTVRTFGQARLAAVEAGRTGDSVYVGNARGAKIATAICWLVSAGILAFAARMAF